MPLSYAMTATLWSVKNREYRSTSWLLKSFVYNDEGNDKFRRYLNAAFFYILNIVYILLHLYFIVFLNQLD